VSLSGNFGEVRLGRDQVPTFQKLTSYDLFSATGIGQFMGFRNWAAGQGADDNGIRANNLISYYPQLRRFQRRLWLRFRRKANHRYC
jgi:predicted porin